MLLKKYKMSIICCVCLLFVNLVVLFIALTYNTTQVKSLLEISALHNNRTYIRNEQELLEKLNKMIQGGSGNLQIITDFDKTLTTDPKDSGKIVYNSYEMLRLCPSIPQTYREEDLKLLDTFKPIESNPNLSVDEKSKLMVEWYRASHNLLRGLKFPREELEDIARNASSGYRETVHKLVDWTQANDVPLIVLSSGLGDAVVASLKAAHLLTPNVKVISNFLKLDNDDIITGMKGEPIHIYNKNEASLMNTEYYRTLKDRTNVILMGDSLGDANMADGINNSNTVIKIGFLSGKQRNNLQTYLNNFDIVLVNDQTMDVVCAVVNLL